jgi:hypothetical protein
MGVHEEMRQLYNFSRTTGRTDIKMALSEVAVGRCGLDSSGTGQGPVAVSCEHGNETSGSIKGGEFLD